MGHDKISSGINCQENGFDSLLEAASSEARRISRTIQEVAGTAACKGVQINALKKWAIQNDCWIYNRHSLGMYSDRGSENEVYMDSKNELIYKLNLYFIDTICLPSSDNYLELYQSLSPN